MHGKLREGSGDRWEQTMACAMNHDDGDIPIWRYPIWFACHSVRPAKALDDRRDFIVFNSARAIVVFFEFRFFFGFWVLDFGFWVLDFLKNPHPTLCCDQFHQFTRFSIREINSSYGMLMPSRAFCASVFGMAKNISMRSPSTNPLASPTLRSFTKERHLRRSIKELYLKNKIRKLTLNEINLQRSVQCFADCIVVAKVFEKYWVPKRSRIRSFHSKTHYLH
jgi:hypothetical protein